MSVTVCIITYNQSELVSEAVRSVINQSKSPSEIIIADDCSDDGTRERINKLSESYPNKITKLFQNKNKGVAANLNSALEHASTEYVTWMGGDDIIYESKIEKEYKEIKSNNEDIVYSNFNYIDKSGEFIEEWADLGRVPDGNVFKSVCANDWPKGDQFRAPMIPLKIIKQLDYFNESYTIYSDWEFKIRLSSEHTFSYVSDPLSAYRIHKNSITTNTKKETYIKEINRIFDAHSKLMREKLNSEEYEYVLDEIDRLIAELKPWAAKENSKYIKSLYHYIKYLSKNKKELHNLKQHLYFIFPKEVHRLYRSE